MEFYFHKNNFEYLFIMIVNFWQDKSNKRNNLNLNFYKYQRHLSNHQMILSLNYFYQNVYTK
jgi:hypothetical protein